VKVRLDGGSWELAGEFTEIESGRRAKRPQLEAALKACKKHKAKLVVAKLDRLSRNARFLLTLLESGVEVLFADLPENLQLSTSRRPITPSLGHVWSSFSHGADATPAGLGSP
jgi:Resolvase, N terminal domain